MAIDTPTHFRNLVIYELFVRNHGKSGTFAAVIADLPRIKKLGVDAVWLMPIHPIGQARRKGSVGSPYAIADYRAVNPACGTEAEFKQLVDRAHELGLKVMIDVVYNHTSPDSVLARQHPEWFYQDHTGRPIPREPQWSDVIDLKHPDPELSDYLIESLLKWVMLGVDGFRCDVASLVPVEFWQQARQAVAKVKPDFIWLAESVHLRYVRTVRRRGAIAHSDAELYQTFDLTYDYDIHDEWRAAVDGLRPLSDYVKMLELQEGIYPANYIKLRFVENHDQPRITGLTANLEQAQCWTALAAFLPGAFLIYAGQETATHRLPSLFEHDPVLWPDTEPVLTGFLTRLAAVKKDPATNGQFEILAGDAYFQAYWRHSQRSLAGIFNVRGASATVPVNLPDGTYLNLLDDEPVKVLGGNVDLPLQPVIVAF